MYGLLYVQQVMERSKQGQGSGIIPAMSPLGWAVRIPWVLLLVAAPLGAQTTSPMPAPAQRQRAMLLESASAGDRVGYYLYLPPAYDRDTTTRFPLLVFLHGIGERGNGTSELPRVLKFGPPRSIERGRDFPFIIITPQLPARAGHWPVALVDEVVREAERTARVDSARIYLTGLSDGGDASWNYAMAHPSVPAAIVPIASEASPRGICAMRGVPVWAFHGERDRDVKLAVEQRLVDALNACQPPPDEPARLTVYAGAGHLVWTRTYEGSDSVDIYAWLLAHHR